MQTSILPEGWTEAERWCWQQVCASRVADFHSRYGRLDVGDGERWLGDGGMRTISSEFLALIFGDELLRRQIPFRGVRVSGALFTQRLDLRSARIERDLRLEGCRFMAPVDLRALRVDGSISLEGSWVADSVELTGAVIGADLSLAGVIAVGTVRLPAAKVNGHVLLDGAGVNEILDMEGIEIGRELSLKGRARFKGINLTGAIVGGPVDLSSVCLDGPLRMRLCEFSRQLFLRGGGTFKEVDLVGAKIGDELSMSGSVFDGPLGMSGSEIGRDLFMRSHAAFVEVDLVGAKIGGQLDMGASSFRGAVQMSGLVVGQDLFMRENATFHSVELTGARIGGDVDMSGSRFDGSLAASGIEVGQNLLMHDKCIFPDVDLTGAKVGGDLNMSSSTFSQAVTLRDAKVGANLDLSAASVSTFDLSGSVVSGTLCLGSPSDIDPTQWSVGSRLMLRNTTVGAVQDAGASVACWPQELQMQGFVYQRLGNLGEAAAVQGSDRQSRWFVEWLKRDRSISRQPYEKLAQVLRASGDPATANDVLYAARCRTRAEAFARAEWMRWLGMSFLQYTIGYGLGTRYLRVLWWVAGLTLTGFLVLLASADRADTDTFLFAWASLDQALPIIHLDDSHWEYITEHCPRWAIAYFYVQKIAGGLLSACVGAGLAGLTQKS